MQALQISFVGRIMMNEFLRQTHGAQRQRDNLFDVAFFRESEFAASSAEIEQQELGRRSSQAGDHAKMNQAAFFQTGNYFKMPASCSLDPFGEETGVVAVAQGAGAD